jgi:hypothetical protein
MPELPEDAVAAEFAAFRAQEAPHIRPKGLGAVRAAVRRRRIVRTVAGAIVLGLVLFLATGPVGVHLAGPFRLPVGSVPTPGPTMAEPTLSTPSATPIEPTPSPSGATVAPSMTSTTSAAPPTSATAAAAPPCKPSQLTGRVAPSGDNETPNPVIGILTNTAAQACELRGYPDLSVSGYINGGPGPAAVLPVSITHGSVTAHRLDPGPVTVRLEQGGSASFAFKAEQVDTNVYVLTELRVALPDETSPITANVLMGAGAPAQGAPIPLIVTAYVAGISGPPRAS